MGRRLPNPDRLPRKRKGAVGLPYSMCNYHHKRTWKSRARVDEVAGQMAKLDDGPEVVRVHWCPQAGGWHITSSSQADYDRRQTEYYAHDPEEDETG